jgi:hypothetical protein
VPTFSGGVLVELCGVHQQQNQLAFDINESATKQNYERCQWKNIRTRKIETLLKQ